MPRTLIAGFGNLLMGDDGFGVAVAQRLLATELPADTEVLDVGIGGMHFVARLADRFDHAIVIDAVLLGETPGTLHVFDPLANGSPDLDRIDPHLAEPAAALLAAKRLGVLPPRVTMVGCEPRCCAIGVDLDPAVERCVDEAAEMVVSLVKAFVCQ